MYWRRDPTASSKGSFAGPPDWPRNGAILKGMVHELPSKPEGSLLWLEVVKVKANANAKWEECPGCWMQFDQGGLLLHPAKGENHDD